MNIESALPILSETIDDESIPTVDLRNVYAWLESKQKYTDWSKDRLNDYTQGTDYLTFRNFEKRGNSNLGTTKTEYHVTLDVGKEICMMERNAKGREARKYFIACEKAAQQPTIIKERLIVEPIFNQNLIPIFTTSVSQISLF